MNYEGIVTALNYDFWTFELSNKVTVHMGQLAASNQKLKLPDIGTKVFLYNAHYYPCKDRVDTLMLCKKSKIQYRREPEEDPPQYWLPNLINEYLLGPSDLLEIDKILDFIEKYASSLFQQSIERIAIALIECLAKFSKENKTFHITTKSCCQNNVITPLNLKTVSACRYISTYNDEAYEGPYWSFGTHAKSDNFEILTGLLCVCQKYGLLVLMDYKYKVICLITSRKRENVQRFINKFVLIKKYRIFTEIYRDPSVPNFEYLIFDTNDVIIVNNILPVSENNVLMYESIPRSYSYIHELKFILVNKAMISLSPKIKPECWLEVIIFEDSSIRQAFMAFSSFYITVIPMLRIRKTYTLYHQDKLLKYQNTELLRINPSHKCYQILEKTAIIVRNEDDSDNSNDDYSDGSLLTVLEVIEDIENKELISFQGIVQCRKFTEPLPSRIKAHKKCIGYGTPGKKTHSVQFVDDSRQKKIVVYLNDWKNLQIPFGLIPDMRVAVRCVLPQKGAYLKSTALTSFQVLSYEPRIQFDTMNLICDNQQRPLKKSFLGYGNLVPTGVLICAEVHKVQIRSLKLWCSCTLCDLELMDPDSCSCGNSERILKSVVKSQVSDEYGESFIISKSTEVVRILFDLEVAQWDIVCKAFEKIGSFNFSNYEEIAIKKLLLSPKEEFCKAFNKMKRALNTTAIINLELICRKMDSARRDHEGFDLWYCQKAKKL